MSRLHSRAALALVASSLAGCSFLLDFPDQGEGGSAPASGGGGGTGASNPGGGGAGGGVPVPVAELLVWRGIADLETDNESVATTGLVFNETLEKLYAYGNTSAGLDGFDIPAGASNQFFLLGFPEETAPELLMNGIACDGTWGGAATRRMRQFDNDDALFLTGSIGTVPTFPAVWAFGVGSDDACGTETEVSLSPTNDTVPTDVPFSVGYDGDEVYPGPLPDCDGVLIEWNYRDPVLATIGATAGSPLETPNSDTSYFIMMQEDVLGEPVVKVFDEIPSELAAPGSPKASWVGAIEVDGLKKAWFTGSSCDIINGCDDPQMFLGRFDLEEQTPEFLVKDPGMPSGGTSLAFADGMILVGGRYEGTVTIGSEVLPEVDWAVPLVVAVESTTQAVLWSFPSDEIAAGIDTSRWRTVSDLAVVGNRETGHLFVAGCSVPPTAETLDCLTPEPGKTGFLMKIALATGELVSTSEIALDDEENDMFIPTAMTASEDRVFVAVSYRGEMNAWGLDLDSGPSVDSAILRVIP